MFGKVFVAALALTAAVSAQSSSASSATATSTASACLQSEVTATAQADLDSLSSCTTFSGNIILAETLSSATITGIQEIEGNLICKNNTQISSISAPSLQSIGGAFTLNGLTVLGTLSFPELTSIGSINWVTLPAIDSLTFTTGVTSCDQIYISDTDLSTLNGITLDSVTTLDINNNLNLNEIEMPLTSVSDQIDVSFNGETTISFPNLIWANNLTFQDVESISTPKLQTVNASYILISNNFEKLSAPNLTSVGGLSIIKNDDLTSISFPKLATIGSAGLEISNNTQLEEFSFPKVSAISGAIVLSGSFDNATFDDLTLVRGAVTISSDEDFDCSAFDKMNDDNDIRGNDYVCSAASSSSSSVLSSSAASSSVTSSASASSAVATSSSAASTSAASSSSTAGAVAFGPNTQGVAFGGIIAALFFGIF
ncbi:hypothetical protein BZA70DRAFT_285684 [Myxozyma melibiosi]|uniref:Uncharacterized protein n=1 Tax=Myxozyma melibiosi TaxID=54550 RepID=A0ABR1EYI9_9ASCO